MTIAYVPVNYLVLRELLRLPKDVTITGVVSDPLIPGTCTLLLTGNVPSGPLTVDYSFEHTTLVKFVAFKQTP